MSEKPFEMRHFQAFAQPEKPAVAALWAAGVAPDGRNEKYGSNGTGLEYNQCWPGGQRGNPAERIGVMRSILLTVALTLLLMPAVFAGQITGGTVGLISPGHVITFEELALTENEAVTTQFALYGATFTGVGADVNNAYGGGGSTGFSGSTYLFSGFSGFSLPVVIGFDSPVNAAAIAAVDQGDTFDVVAYLGGTSGTLVDSLSITIPANPPGVGFVGFTGETFDTLVFTGTGALGLDTLEFNSAVPEPANVFFIGLGLAFMAARRKLIR